MLELVCFWVLYNSSLHIFSDCDFGTYTFSIIIFSGRINHFMIILCPSMSLVICSNADFDHNMIVIPLKLTS